MTHFTPTRLLGCATAMLLGASLMTGVTTVSAAAPAEAAACYNTQRDATYNTPGCFSVRHWVTRKSTGTARTYGAWVGKRGTSMVISYVDWKSSGTQTS